MTYHFLLELHVSVKYLDIALKTIGLKCHITFWVVNRLPPAPLQLPHPMNFFARRHEAQPSGLGFQFHAIQVTLIPIGAVAGPQGILQQVPGHDASNEAIAFWEVPES